MSSNNNGINVRNLSAHTIKSSGNCVGGDLLQQNHLLLEQTETKLCEQIKGKMKCVTYRNWSQQSWNGQLTGLQNMAVVILIF